VSAHRPADHREKFFNTEVIHKPALNLYHVALGDCGKIRAVTVARCRIDAVGPGGAAAAAQNVGADDKIAVCVDRFARTDRDIPPSGIVLRRVTRDM